MILAETDQFSQCSHSGSTESIHVKTGWNIIKEFDDFRVLYELCQKSSYKPNGENIVGRTGMYVYWKICIPHLRTTMVT